MLQLLDDGRLTDGKGRTVDFKNAVVIMTSNIGSHFIAETAIRGEAMTEGVKREVMDALRAHFRPEFINRVDDIIIFHALTREQMRTIIDIQLRSLVKRLEDRKMHIELSEAAKDLIIEEGYDPTYGARPLKRTIQRRILDPLALRVLQGDFREGDRVRIDVKGGDIAFEKAEQDTLVGRSA
jgi:ATP-dependent Clp protease ATP-binding subunit ClpB